MQQLIEQQQQETISLNDIANGISNAYYDGIDYIGQKIKKAAPLINTTLKYSWIPVVVYMGLKQGTHKYYSDDKIHIGDSIGNDVAFERKASWTDTIPIIGSHGASKPGLFGN